MQLSRAISQSPVYKQTYLQAEDPHKIPDCLDLFITNGIASGYLDIDSNKKISLDHTLGIAVFPSIQEKSKIVRLANNKTDWKYFREVLVDKINLKLLKKTKKSWKTQCRYSLHRYRKPVGKQPQ